MALPEEEPNDILQDGIFQPQDGVVQRRAECNQNETSTGIQFSNEFEASASIVNPISVGDDTSVSFQNDHQSIREDQNTDDFERDGVLAQPKSETRSRRERDMPVSQSCTNNLNIPKSQNIHGHAASRSQNPTLMYWMGFIFLFCWPGKCLVDASVGGLCGFNFTILDCNQPFNSNTTWIGNRTTFVKEGIRITKDSNITLAGNENLKIMTTGNEYLINYQCEISTPKDYVREFSLKDFNECCCQKLPKDSSRAEIEMAIDLYIFYFDAVYYGETLTLIPSAQKVKKDVAEKPYCSAKFPESEPVDSVRTANNSEKETTTAETGGRDKSSDALKIFGYVAGIVAGIFVISLVFCCVVKRLKKSRIRSKQRKLSGAAVQLEPRSGTIGCLSRLKARELEEEQCSQASVV